LGFEDLLYDSSRICVEMAGDVIREKPGVLAEAMDLAETGRSVTDARAARAIYFGTTGRQEMIFPHLERIIHIVLTHQSNSVRQNFLKILSEMDLPDKEDIVSPLITRCFDWINTAESTPAVKVYSLEILYRMSLKIPELQNELMFSIENQLEQSSVAFKTRGNRILKKLRSDFIFHFSLIIFHFSIVLTFI